MSLSKLPKSLFLSLFVANVALADPVSLFPGWTAEVAPGGVSRFTIADPSVVSGSSTVKGGVTLTGLKEGSTTVELWAAGATTPRTLEVKVEATGWDLVPVLAAASDIPEETKVIPGMIAVRYVPRAFVTSSVIRPAAQQYILNQPTNVPVQAGDLLLWSEFERKRQ